MTIELLRAFSDNYIFVMHRAGDAVVVDPGDAAPVEDWLDRSGARLRAVLVTHHHRDHVGGVPRLAARIPGLRVYASQIDRGRVPAQTHALGDGDILEVLGRRTRVLAVPGHTRGHIAYFVEDGAAAGDLFSGDTIFPGTIGNLFEGTPADLFGSLLSVRALPSQTRIWCAHEYARLYLKDALAVDPDNPRLVARLAALAALPPDAPSVPFTLEEECATSPFFRWDAPAIRSRLGTTDDRETFLRLCEAG